MDFFQDILNDCETGNVAGHMAPIASGYKVEQNADEDEALNQDESLVFESPSLSVPGITGWLTGSEHKPNLGKRFKIPVYFDHNCLKNKPGHPVCFAVVSACAKSITFPVQHLQYAALYFGLLQKPGF